ncbi:hypothetical protein [Thermosulfidibacter takaii]|uniref:hypothetical protein n=1 Tax=Thermosulfidibacter takaii TaxID=412593 RepID=UPI00130DFD7A|nr:hypothetical protein [Thermosulfidibacter takaii]
MGCGGCRGCDYDLEDYILSIAEEERQLTSAGIDEKEIEVLERVVEEEENILSQKQGS